MVAGQGDRDSGGWARRQGQWWQGKETGTVVAGQGDRDSGCLLYTSDAADEDRSVDLGGRRIIKKIFF